MTAPSVDTPQVEVSVQPGDVAEAEKGTAKRTPRRVIYFQDGDQLEEYSTDEEEEPDKVDLAVQRLNSLDWKTLPWGSYLFNFGVFGFLRVFKSLEYAGEVISYKLGITAPKYQSEIEEAERMEAEEQEERSRAATEDASWGGGAASNGNLKAAPDVLGGGTPFGHQRLSQPIASSTPIH